MEHFWDEIVARIERKIAGWTFIPEENGEEIKILHYENGQNQEPHYDPQYGFFRGNTSQQLGGPRIATVVMYLSDVQKGGETIFPESERKLTQTKDDTWSDCAKNGYAVKPEKGDALLFFSLHPDVEIDPSSLHGGCPVLEGEKWVAVRWIHVRAFEYKSEECKDENDYCVQWAAAGECEKNRKYMVGSERFAGVCRKSCRACVP